jgi:amino acid adenylation domain-containing protein
MDEVQDATLCLPGADGSAEDDRRFVQLPVDFDRSAAGHYQASHLPFGGRTGATYPMTHAGPAQFIGAFGAFLSRITGQSSIDLDVALAAPGGAQPPISLTVQSSTSKPLGAAFADAANLLSANADDSPTSRSASNVLVRIVDVPSSNGAAPPAGAPVSQDAAPYELEVLVAFEGDRLQLGATFNGAIHLPATISRLFANFGTFLQAALREPETPVGLLPIIAAEEFHSIVVDLDSGTALYAAAPVHRLFEKMAQMAPWSTAVAFQATHLTYEELDTRSSRLAHHLVAQGVGPEVAVGVCLSPSLDLVVALVAILKAGGVYLPLDPTHPASLVAHMLDETRPRLVLTRSALASLTHRDGLTQFLFDREGESLESYPTTALASTPELGAAACLLYTSGTTGKPKGVVITHGNLAHYIHVAQQRYRFGPGDTFCSLARYTFSISLFDLVSPLCCGGSVRLVEREAILSPENLLRELAQVTVVHAGPSLLSSLFRYLRLTPSAPKTLPGIRHASSGGDLVPPAVSNEMTRVFSNAEVYVIYGCTEISCMGTTYPVEREVRTTRSFVGKPFPDVTVRVLDSNQNVVPFGVVGEICFAGKGIVRGYLDRPELTAEKFVAIGGQRFYRTGDVGRLHSDGNLEMLGRRDFQVQLRGIRIELGGIENTVRELGLAAQCIVVLKTVDEGDTRLVAYVVKPGAHDIVSFRRAIAEHLPDYMVPQHVVVLEAMPLTLNGKLDRNRLQTMPWDVPQRPQGRAAAEPGVERSGADDLSRLNGQALPVIGTSLGTVTRDVIAPRNAIETRLSAIFAHVLGSTVPSVTDSFFDLGGHSLLAVRLFAEIEKEFGARLPFAKLFATPTVEQLGLHLAQQQSAGVAEIVPITRRAGEPVVPVVLSSAQERLWFLDQLEGPSATYNVYEAWRLRGSLDRAALERALKGFVQRHEALRTNIARVKGGQRTEQIVHDHLDVQLEYTDLSGHTGREEDAVRLADEVIDRPFDLALGPLVRAQLVKVDAREHLLVLVVHHIVFDAWSAGIMRRELAELYAASLEGREPRLPAVAINYADYALWEARHLAGETWDQSLGFWREYLQGAPDTLDLPMDYPTPAVQSYRGAQIQAVISPRLVQRLGQLAQAEHGTVFHVVMAAWKILLARYSGQTDLVVGTAMSTRNRAELEAVVGFFVNMLPLRTQLAGEPTVRETVRRVQAATIAAMTYNDLPFERLVQALNPPRGTGRPPIFQVCLSYLKDEEKSEFGPLELIPESLHPTTAKFDLTLWLTERPDGLHLALEFATDLFSRDRAGRMLAHYLRLLEAMVEQPDAPIGQLPLLTDEESRKVLIEWNVTRREFPREKRVHELFEMQVQQQPAAEAVRFGDQAISYAQLNDRADALAAVLRGLGVGPDVLVGLCVERSFDLLVGVLGIFKAGGAYVPIDPAFPADRVAHMLEDSRAPILVTQRPLLATLPASAAHRICLDEPLPAPRPPAGPTAAPSATDLAYVLYTSGSTGLPKGVAVPHRAVVNFLNSMRREPGLKKDDVLLAVTTLSFDIAGLELHLPLTTGATLVLASREEAADGVALLRAIERHKVTVLQATPATWRLMLAADWSGPPTLKALCGGEAMPADLAGELIAHCAELWNMYGPTETTIWSTCCRVTDASEIHIGRPIDNTEIYIVDAHLQPLPVGLAGELLIGGEGLARGYLNRPELTAASFIPHPFKPGQRLYRTGDLARYRSDSNIECLGRLDFQIKIRGFRIEPGEIENQLVAHPAVRQAVVVAREFKPGDLRLVAYLVARSGLTADAADLRRHLRDALPEYMVPSAFVWLESLPLTANGKINRKALPAPGASTGGGAEHAVAPRNPIEQRLRAIFEESLGSPVPSVTDSFFDLGGHSLLAVRVFAEIEREFGIRLPLARLFDSPTIAQLAVILSEKSGHDAQWASLVPIRTRTGKPALFLVHGAGGNILLYRELAEALGEDVSVYGFQSQGLDGLATPLTRIEDMATHYVRELRAFQPAGPYHLGGYCMGGSVAYEMARQLRRQGESVGLLALLDTYNLSTIAQSGTRIGWFSRRLQKANFHLGNLLRLGPGNLRGYLSEKLRMAREAARAAASLQLRRTRNALHSRSDTAGALVGLQELNDAAAWQYVPQPYDGMVTIFRPQKNYDFMPDPQLGWGKVVEGRIDLVQLPIHPHAMLIGPWAGSVAKELKLRLPPPSVAPR